MKWVAPLLLLLCGCMPPAPPVRCDGGMRTPTGVCVYAGPAIVQIPGADLASMTQWVVDAQDAYGHQLTPGFRVFLYRSQDTVSAAALREYDMDVECLSGYGDDEHIVTIPGAFLHELAHDEIAAEGIEEPGYLTDTLTGEYVDAHTPEYGWDEQRLRRINDAVRVVGNAPGGAGQLCRRIREQ